jgi:4a-hydroxytetrahydrobiopterin dehydratase
MTDFAKKRCIPCEGNVPPLTLPQARDLMQHIPGWSLSEDGASITKDYTFANFDETMQFVNMVAELAETEGHHPDMQVGYGKLHLTLTTHAIGGLSENDVILAAKINELGAGS